jgi:hypothetical protein
MINSTITKLTTNGKRLGFCRALLLAVALLETLPSVKASEWGFTLIGQPSAAVISEEGAPEVFRISGAGSFDPEGKAATGSGSFLVVNGLDDVDASLGGPTFRGTWKVTDFISWTPDGGPNKGQQGGTLKVRMTLSFSVGLKKELKGFEFPGVILTVICPIVNGQFIESDDAITVDFGFEKFDVNTTGFTAFHLKKP